MGLSLPKDLTIAGFRASMFKDALKAFSRTCSPENFVALKSVGGVRSGAIIFEECLDHGLIAQDGLRFKLTDSGEAIASSKAASRSPLSRAIGVVDQLLENASAINANTESVRLIDEIWLFGSVMRRQESVGDIDIAITSSRRPPFDKDFSALEAEVKRILSLRNDVPLNQPSYWQGEHWLTERALFGARRHPLLAGAHFELSDLKQLAVPCQLIFDRKRGGRVQDEIVPRHPDSRGRSNEIGPPPFLPDFDNPPAMRPMDGRWTTGFERWGGVSPYSLFGGWNDAAHALYPTPPRGVHVLAEDHHWSNEEWKPKRLAKPGLDGRERLLIANQDGWAGFSVVLRREIVVTAEAIEIHAWLEEPEFRRVRTQLSGLAEDISATMALIVAGDAERALRRQHHLGARPKTAIVLRRSEIAKPVLDQVLEPVQSLLQDRKVRIEPEPWQGAKVDIVLA